MVKDVLQEESVDFREEIIKREEAEKTAAQTV
jgi:hypothetical protein